ncbi:hypothetical protein K8S19_12595 [bacterium]|nr:hypothetical protein [bacterium]
MGLIIGILAVLLVLFLIFTMAIAEWADKDIGEVFRSLFNKKKVPAKTHTSAKGTQSEIVLPADLAEEKSAAITVRPVKRAVKKKAKPAVKKTAKKSSGSGKIVIKAAVKTAKIAKPKTKSQKGKKK